MDMKLEVVTIPVSDVSRAREFYASLGWRLDTTPPVVVQLTPPGSGCSVQFGPNRTTAPPGSAQGMFVIVSDIEAARNKLAAAGVESEAYHGAAHVSGHAVPTQREQELAGQTVVVIGGSAGIGLETARRTRAEGADVILTARNPGPLQQAAARLGEPVGPAQI